MKTIFKSRKIPLVISNNVRIRTLVTTLSLICFLNPSLVGAATETANRTQVEFASTPENKTVLKEFESLECSVNADCSSYYAYCNVITKVCDCFDGQYWNGSECKVCTEEEIEQQDYCQPWRSATDGERWLYWLIFILSPLAILVTTFCCLIYHHRRRSARYRNRIAELYRRRNKPVIIPSLVESREPPPAYVAPPDYFDVCTPTDSHMNITIEQTSSPNNRDIPPVDTVGQGPPNNINNADVERHM